MDILVIGNGFDLAHGLPTKYTDFLEYTKEFLAYHNGVLHDSPRGKQFSDALSEHKRYSEFCEIENNQWLKYFLNRYDEGTQKGDTWIDFEKEISEIVIALDNANPIVEYAHYLNAPSEITLDFENDSVSDKLRQFISLLCEYDKTTQKHIISNNNIVDAKTLVGFLYLQLRYFARAFETYCLHINETIAPEMVISSKRKEQIKKAKFQMDSHNSQARHASGYGYSKNDVPKYEKMRNEASKLFSSLISGITAIDYLSMSKFDCVLSFNYTNTYERLYGNENTKYCYIHGKAQYDSAKTNIVFGIDDNLQRGEESRDFKLVRFKKYYQRIIFMNGSEYKTWLGISEKERNRQNYVHIVGHSLDRTDYDVLYEIFSNNKFKILVYFYNLDDYEDKVQKTIQLLAYKGGNGRDELIRRVYSEQWTIKFVNQYDKDQLYSVKP